MDIDSILITAMLSSFVICAMIAAVGYTLECITLYEGKEL